MHGDEQIVNGEQGAFRSGPSIGGEIPLPSSDSKRRLD